MTSHPVARPQAGAIRIISTGGPATRMTRLLLVSRGPAGSFRTLVEHSLESMGALDRRRVRLIAVDPETLLSSPCWTLYLLIVVDPSTLYLPFTVDPSIPHRASSIVP